jgi:hypothetical protein
MNRRLRRSEENGLNARRQRMIRIALGALIGLAFVSPASAVDTFSFTPKTSAFPFVWHVVVNGVASDNPTLHVTRGKAYDFVVNNNLGHPFYVKTVNGNGTANGYSDFSPNGISTSSMQTVSFTVPADAPDSLFYNCAIHTSMSGAIDVSIFRDGFGD